jgi:hypothetical protein
LQNDDHPHFNVTSYSHHKQPEEPPPAPDEPAPEQREEKDDEESSTEELTYTTLSKQDPLTLKEALSAQDGDRWIDTMEEELNSLIAHQTYELVNCPPGRKPVRTKWVYQRKHNKNGEVIRLKARVVVQGYTQVPGVDFLETHAPVVSITVLCALLNIAVIRDWKVHQVDVDLTYLNSNIDQELYCKQPPGYAVAGKEHQVWKLLKALYGLKQGTCGMPILRES